MTPDRLSYRFGPLERRGLLGPLRSGQVICLGAGAVIAIATLNQWPTAKGAIAGTLAFAGAIALAVWPIGRRTLE